MMTPVFSAVSLLVALQSATLQPDQLNAISTKSAQDCVVIVDAVQRLACYDDVFKPGLSNAQQATVPVDKVLSPAAASPKALPSEAATLMAPVTAPVIAQSTSTKIRKSNQAELAAVDAVDSFGAEHLKSKEDTESKLDVVTFTIDRIVLTARKQQRFVFTTGQVWENKSGNTLRVKPGDAVEIKDGALTAFYLSKVGSKRNARVKRLK